MAGDEKLTENPSEHFADMRPAKATPDAEGGDGKLERDDRALNAKLADPFVRTLVEASGDPFFVLDVEGKICLANQAALRITGRSAVDLKGTAFCDSFTQPEKALEALVLVVNTGFVSEWPLKIPRGNERTSFVLLNALVCRGDGGEALGVFAALRDVTQGVRRKKELRKYRERLEELVEERTLALAEANELLQRQILERKNAEVALRRSEERFRRLAENAPDIIYRYELIPQSRFSYVSPGVERITGHSPAEYYSNPDLCFQLVHPEDQPVLEGVLLHGCSPEGRSASSFPAVRWLHKDGFIVWTEEHTVPIWDEFGRLVAVEGIARNISQRKEMEQALETALRQLEGIVEFLPDATFVIDREQKVVAWNRAIEEMTGMGKGDILGKGDHAYAFPFYGEGRPILIDLVLSRDAEYEKKYEYVRTKGETLYAEALVPMLNGGKGAYLWITASPLYGGDGKLIGAIESIRDVTDHKMLEDALRTNAEKIKRFAYSVSHDLKSPIIGLNGITRLLHRQYRDFLDERGRAFCDQILKASEQVLALIEEINVYIKTKEIPLDFEPIQPKEVIAIVRNEFETLLSIRHIQWVEPETIPAIRADRVSILRVFRNLVDNALKYGGEALSRIKIGYGSTEEHHILSVSDDGVGIKGEDTERIFGVFQRNETSRGVEGTGLGLAIVKEIAEKHKGQVWVEPGVKNGTTFHLYISKNL